MGTDQIFAALGGPVQLAALDVAPTSALRFVLIWIISGLALAGLSERRLRQQVMGLWCRTVFPVLLGLVFLGIPWGAHKQFPQWWDRWWTHALPVCTLLLGLALWLLPQGARLSWSGMWDFRYPLTTPESETAREKTGETPSATLSAPGERQLAVPRQTRLRLLGYLMLLVGLAGTAIPTMVVSSPHAYPDWVRSNGFLLGVTGFFVILYGGKILVLARSRRERDFPSLPVREDAWVGALLWLAAWLCCLAGMAMTFGAMPVMLDARSRPWWATFIAFPLMLIGGLVFTQGRKTFLRARRHRARIIPSPRILEAGSYVLYLRPFDADQHQTAMQQDVMPGSVGGVTGFVLSGRSAEEQIADALRPVGPLIAVGAPGERQPHVGAVRMYLPKKPDKAWQEPVRQLMRRSRLTVLTLGTSEGTMWELNQALNLLSPQRLILVIPSIGKEDYERIRTEIDATRHPNKPTTSGSSTTSRLPAPRLPDCPSWLAPDHREPVQGIIHFAADWTPTVTNVMKTHQDPRLNLFTALLPSLKPAFTALEEHEQRTGQHCC
ncbi:hypothetical protein [Nocardia pseudovaccinii]|uniref:hypothetical protein n=1 Tax=Nocardia pseudovaccinii TaxID=189540 RepID=UPI0007A4A7D8|nr:hypothetical protein [Nocardia pseudovaccinii]